MRSQEWINVVAKNLESVELRKRCEIKKIFLDRRFIRVYLGRTYQRCNNKSIKVNLIVFNLFIV